MGVSMLTALTIANRDDIVIDAGGPHGPSLEHPEWENKYIGWITLGEEDNFRPLLNSDPIYDNPEQAKTAMQDLVIEIKKQVKETINE